MFKIGFKAAHFMSSHKVGTVVDIITEKNNQMTIGGTTSARVYIVLEYREGDKVARQQYTSGDLIRIYD